MFSEELESVIEAALADGVLTAKEREVLHKRAAAEGVDPDELDVVIDGRLAKMKREEDWLRPAPPSDKFGEVKKCPRCGEPVEPMAVKCSACGYEFRGVEALKSSQQFAEKLEAILEKYRNVEYDGKGNVFLGTDSNTRTQQQQVMELLQFIKNFPVPTTKEDLLDFAISMQSKWNAEPSVMGMKNSIAQAYKAKYDECVNKAKILFPNDPMFQGVFDQHNVDNTKKKGCLPFMALAIIATSILFIVC